MRLNEDKIIPVASAVFSFPDDAQFQARRASSQYFLAEFVRSKGLQVEVSDLRRYSLIVGRGRDRAWPASHGYISTRGDTMANFKILLFSRSHDALGRSCVAALLRLLDEHKSSYSVTEAGELPPLWDDDCLLSHYPTLSQQIYQEVAEADGGYFFVPVSDVSAIGHAKAIIDIVAGALSRKACAFVISQGSLGSHGAVRDLMGSLAFEHQTFCYPRILHILPEDFDASLRPSAELQRRLATLVAEFSVFAAAIKLFAKTTGHAAAIPVSQLDALRVNHLNILTRDLPKSLQFYADTLGVRYLYDLGRKKAVTDLGGFEFLIEEVAEVCYPPGFHFGVRTTQNGVFALYERLKAMNVKFVKGNGPALGAHLGPDRVRTALYFEDPDGLMIEVYSPELSMIERSRELLAE